MIRLLLFVPALLGLKQSTVRNHISVLELEKTPTLPSTTARKTILKKVILALDNPKLQDEQIFSRQQYILPCIFI